MITIDSDKNITLTRGDTFAKILSLKKDGEDYIPQEGDSIKFTMATSYKGERGYDVKLQKYIPTDTLLWKINPNDTAELPYDVYNYDLEITYADGTVETFVSAKLRLTKEVG